MEEVEGKEIALCHIISHPSKELKAMLDLDGPALAILSVTPGEAAYIAADCMTHSSPVKLVCVDRYLGSVVLTGKTAALEHALKTAVTMLDIRLGFPPVCPTHS